MSAHRIILAPLPSFCQKLSKLVEILRSTDKNNFAQFFETRCIIQNPNDSPITDILAGVESIHTELIDIMISCASCVRNLRSRHFS